MPGMDEAKLGVLAGSGELPEGLMAAAGRAGFSLFVGVVRGAALRPGDRPSSPPEGAPSFAVEGLGDLNGFRGWLSGHGVARVCVAGAVRKFAASELLASGAVAGAAATAAAGSVQEMNDSALLGLLKADFAGAGIAIVAPQELMPELAVGAGGPRRAPPFARLRGGHREGGDHPARRRRARSGSRPRHR